MMEPQDIERRLTACEEKYFRLVEHMTTILRAVRTSEGEQISNEEIAKRVVAMREQLSQQEGA